MTARAALMVMLQDVPETVSQPLQPVKVDPLSGFGREGHHRAASVGGRAGGSAVDPAITGGHGAVLLISTETVLS